MINDLNGNKSCTFDNGAKNNYTIYVDKRIYSSLFPCKSYKTLNKYLYKLVTE